MLFKGTAGKSSLEIVKFIESMGGSFDAYTSKENLIIMTKFLTGHLADVFNLIAEILLESNIGIAELAREKSVILEEIKTENDDPSDYVFELLFSKVFGDHPMGLPIAGTEQSVMSIDVAGAREFYRRLLTNRLVIAISGNFDGDVLARLAAARFGSCAALCTERVAPRYCRPAVAVQTKKEISQVHLACVAPSVAYDSPERHATLILNTIFGGGMSSRMFQALREAEGLVYEVQSYVDFYVDCGIFGYYLVTDRKNLERTADKVRQVYKTIRDEGFSDEEIKIAKAFITGNLLLGLESSTNRMLRLGRETMYLDKVSTVDDVVAKISNVSSAEINGLIGRYFDHRRYSIAAVGPVTEGEVVDAFGSEKGQNGDENKGSAR